MEYMKRWKLWPNLTESNIQPGYEAPWNECCGILKQRCVCDYGLVKKKATLQCPNQSTIHEH